MASEVTLRRHSKRELLAMVERGLAVQEGLWRLQEQHEVRGQIVAEQADQLAACRDELARLAAALDAREREVAALREALEWYADKKNWTDEGVAVMAFYPGGWVGASDYQDADYTCDNGECARAALAAVAAPPQAGATGTPYELATLLAALGDVESRLVSILRDEDIPIYACRYCHGIGEDAADRVEHQDWCIVMAVRAALAAPPQPPATELARLNAIQDEAERELVRLTDALHEIETAHRKTLPRARPWYGNTCAWCGGDWDTHHTDCPLVIARRALAAPPQRPATGEDGA